MTVNRMAQMTLIGATWSLLAAVATAQPEGPPPGFFSPGSNLAELALQKSVQEQLALTDEEASALKPLVDEITHSREVAWRASRASWNGTKRRKKMQELSVANDKKVAEIMHPARFHRLKQISWQVQGPGAFRDLEVINLLALTPAQIDENDRLAREGREEMTKLFTGGGGFNANIFDKAREPSSATAPATRWWPS